MIHVARLSPIIGDDAVSSGSDDAAASPIFAPTDLFTNAGAGITFNPVIGTASAASDPGATLGPIEDKNSAGVEHLAPIFGVGSQAAPLDATLENAAAGGEDGNVSPGSSGSGLHLAMSGGGVTDALSSGGATNAPVAGAGAIAPSSFGAGSVPVGGGSDENALAGPFSPLGNQLPDGAAGGPWLDSQLSHFVQAMATFSAADPGLVSSSVGQLPNDTGLQGAISAAWHQ